MDGHDIYHVGTMINSRRSLTIYDARYKVGYDRMIDGTIICDCCCQCVNHAVRTDSVLINIFYSSIKYIEKD